MRRVIGSRGLSHACQNSGIKGREIVTPQKRPNVIIIGGLRRFAMNALGVTAATICPSVIEKNYCKQVRDMIYYLIDQNHKKLVTSPFRAIIESTGIIKAKEVLFVRRIGEGIYHDGRKNAIRNFSDDNTNDKGELRVHLRAILPNEYQARHIVSRLDLRHNQSRQNRGLKDNKNSVLKVHCFIPKLPKGDSSEKSNHNMNE